MIKTFPRKGIRFVGLVREDQQLADTVQDQARAEAQGADVAVNDPVLGPTESLHAVASTADSPAREAGEPGIARGIGRWRFETRRARRQTTVAATAGSPAKAAIEAAGGGGGGASAGPASERSLLPSGLIVFALSTVLVVGVWMLWPWRHAASAPSVLTMMASPTIAVLRFTTLGSQNESRSLAAGLEAEVRSELARVHRGFDLIIRSASDDRGPAIVTQGRGVSNRCQVCCSGYHVARSRRPACQYPTHRG